MLTCVSGFWNINNKHGNQYITWFQHSLKINCPYVFFADKETIEMIKPFRDGLPTFYIECKIEDFVTYAYKDKMITHPIHCPSVELNLIWNEKIFFIQKALKINPFNSDFFCWVDAGLCTYRTISPPSTPFPDITKLNKLPKDKFIYTSSNSYNESEVLNNNYYHHVSGTYILHKTIVNDVATLFSTYLNTLLDTNNLWTDQVILTHIYKNHKHLFHKLGDGYGELFYLLI